MVHEADDVLLETSGRAEEEEEERSDAELELAQAGSAFLSASNHGWHSAWWTLKRRASGASSRFTWGAGVREHGDSN